MNTFRHQKKTYNFSSPNATFQRGYKYLNYSVSSTMQQCPILTAKIVKILNLSFIDLGAANLGFQNFSISTSTWQRLFEPLSMIMMIIIPCPWREDRTHLTNGRIVCCMGAQDDSLLGYFHLRIYQNLSYKASPRASLSNQISFLP